ncbi:VanZ family protein [Microbacterium esteraromaticum]|uniref:VanZ family protein n=1 Tax=Microbacterium esteraromaticum TaxID=57043 RepID=A0A7D7WI63_9MICO|nr:VanZ family protein [Microbacterium esteraromaticum]QMU96970.1 VanZ family protein [Microbacterium esteraromaticum]
MGEQVLLGALAIGIGVLAGVALFVPFVSISYRRRGRLSLPRLLMWFAALVYFWAIWTYTLLPLPEPDSIRCVGMITDPMEMVRDVQKAIAAPGSALSNPALLQLVFNVLLFVPLGFFVRVLFGRGILTALLVGSGLSLFVETTQLTGVWGVYPCAYRFFDVGDLVTNTSGALLGAVFGLVVPRARRGLSRAADALQPRPVTRGRRALAMLCDGLGFFFTSTTIAIAVQLFIGYVLHDRVLMIEGVVSGLAGTGGAAAVWLVVTLVTGQSVGDAAVQLRYAGSGMPPFAARLLRWLGGVAGLSAVGLIGSGVEALSNLAMLAACVLFLFTSKGRGLPGILSGQQLVDAREEGSGQDASARPSRQ